MITTSNEDIDDSRLYYTICISKLYFNYFTHISSVIFHSNDKLVVPLYSLVYKWDHWKYFELNNLPKFTQVIPIKDHGGIAV